ncbi:hypothetical protein BMQ_pBM50042 (plasmid) [Priestia megaterium QM B1551]|uniref:Uncharacterized protein n=1 Tax=Priestia megaterium (strain ATCC 12872 / QMB1551) TaxID=545693 RepID=D5E3K6_PRIM1|nr:hypothetical protein BMQ_pBM50042 [Priestia megaterium QM B1551]
MIDFLLKRKVRKCILLRKLNLILFQIVKGIKLRIFLELLKLF